MKGVTTLKYSKVPEATIRRLSRYSRCLEELEEKGEKVVSSAQLASKCAVNSAQVRKDLAYFGEFGIRGVGYYVKDLLSDIKRILGSNKEWRMAVIGMGNLGSALLSYKDFLKQNYKIVAAFDIDPPKVIGKVSEKLGKPMEVLHINRIKEVAKDRKIEIALIATPPSEAQGVVQILVDAGIRGILNFTPTPGYGSGRVCGQECLLHHHSGQSGLPFVELIYRTGTPLILPCPRNGLSMSGFPYLSPSLGNEPGSGQKRICRKANNDLLTAMPSRQPRVGPAAHCHREMGGLTPVRCEPRQGEKFVLL